MLKTDRGSVTAMAQCASSPSCVKLSAWRSSVKESARYTPQISHFRVFRRKYSISAKLSRWERCCVWPLSFEVGSFVKKTSLKCNFSGFWLGPEGATASELVSVTDQLLLMTSIFLTYMAGVVPLHKPNFSPRKNVLEDKVILAIPVSSGGSCKRHDGDTKCAWDAVKEKLLDSLDAIEHRSNLGSQVHELEQQHAKRPLSLFAITEGPKLRLLLASFQHLEEEVNNALGDAESVNMDRWMTIFPDIIRKSCSPACMTWMEHELQIENKSDKAFVPSMIEKLKGGDILLQNIRKLGKEYLYAELLYFLGSGSLSRERCCYDEKLFVLHGSSVLEDLVITLADGIASAYLELISVDGNLSNEMNNLGLGICNLSTRALQRLRNEVSLNQWLYQNAEAVASMYEDRFDLCTLQLKVIEKACHDQTEKHNWWKKFTMKQAGTSLSLSYIIISQFSLAVKRTKELRALAGWRYYFSLYLELSDITIPMIRVIIEKVSSAISFFLVSLIGRSLGLIYTGIRQSLRWK